MKKLLLGLVLVVIGATASARDIHGVKGYYNFTGASFMTNKYYSLANGDKVSGIRPSAEAYGDYLKVTTGWQSADYKTVPEMNKSAVAPWGTEKQTYTMANFNFNYQSKNANRNIGDVKITKNYPVLVAKFLFPYKDSTVCRMYAEHWWDSPYDTGSKMTTLTNYYTVNGNKVPGMPAFSNSGRATYNEFANGLKVVGTSYTGLQAGMDSTKLVELNPTKEISPFYTTGLIGLRTTKNKDTAFGKTRQDTSHVAYVLPELKMVNGEPCKEVIIMINYKCITDSVLEKDPETGAGVPGFLLDRTEISNIGICFQVQMWNYADSAGTNLPYYYVESIRTASNIAEAMAGITPENNWGDGTDSQAKNQLNYALYYAEQDLKYYNFANPEEGATKEYQALDDAYKAALACYDSPTPQPDETYNAHVQTLTAARETLAAANNPNKDIVYASLKPNADENSKLVLAAETKTIGSLTGYPVVKGDAAVQQNFSLVAGAMDQGKQKYSLYIDDMGIVQATDGTLLAIKGAASSEFTFAGYDYTPSYSIKCGDYYYSIGEVGFEASKSLPDKEDLQWEDLSPYMFVIKDAIAEYKPSYDTSILKNGWEFNEAPVDDPSTKGTLESGEYTMYEYDKTKQVEGWRASRWRMFSRVNQAQYGDAVVLKITSDKYYCTANDTLQATILENTFETSPAIRMDGESNSQVAFWKQDPSPRDSTFEFFVDPGVKRFFAVKMKSNDENTRFGTMNFLNLGNGSVLLDMTEPEGKKGDVYYFDLLKHGFRVGLNEFSSAFFSPEGWGSAGCIMAIDWMRFYEKEADIPEETLEIGLPGDANDDKVVDVADITAIASFILGTTPSPWNQKNADVNNDGTIDVADITATASIILGTK